LIRVPQGLKYVKSSKKEMLSVNKYVVKFLRWNLVGNSTISKQVAWLHKSVLKINVVL